MTAHHPQQWRSSVFAGQKIFYLANDTLYQLDKQWRPEGQIEMSGMTTLRTSPKGKVLLAYGPTAEGGEGRQGWVAHLVRPGSAMQTKYFTRFDDGPLVVNDEGSIYQLRLRSETLWKVDPNAMRP